MMKQLIMGLIAALLTCSAMAYEPVVQKQVFEMPSYTTVGGKILKNVKVGWEAYGTLNPAKDNVILICHYFSGNSHAAGKYSTGDKIPGYWDAIIGAGKPIDTDKFYVVSVDSLVNLNIGNPKVITTGPASINLETGKRYAMSFPIVTIRDFVNVQKALLDSLGVEKLQAVMGASMGALQTYEWAASYPDKVLRAIPVIGTGWTSANLIGWLNVWAAPIRFDPNWKGGDYYNGQPPLKGLADAFKTITLHVQHFEWANSTFGRAWAQEGKDPAVSFDNQYKIEAELDKMGLEKAKLADANHFLYLTKAVQLFVAGGKKEAMTGLQRINAPTLIIYTTEDLIFSPEEIRETVAAIRSDDTPVESFALNGGRGHLNGILNIEQAGDKLKAFLAK